MLSSAMMGTGAGSSNESVRDPAPDARPDSNDERAAEKERLRCPKCGSPDVRRSNNAGVVTALLRGLGRWPFRCRSCRARFYRAMPPEDD